MTTGNNNREARAIRRNERATAAVEMRIAGHTYETIARELGYSSRANAHRAVWRQIDARPREAVGQLRALELQRLEAIHASMWPAALSGDARAAVVVLRAIELRARLTGMLAVSDVESSNLPQVQSMFAGMLASAQSFARSHTSDGVLLDDAEPVTLVIEQPVERD